MSLFQHLERDVRRVVHRYEPTDSRLGRHVNHDSRNYAYALPVLPKAAIQTVHWQRAIPILDQGQLGSCTGNAGTGFLGTANAAGPGLSTVVIAAAAAKASHGCQALRPGHRDRLVPRHLPAHRHRVRRAVDRRRAEAAGAGHRLQPRVQPGRAEGRDPDRPGHVGH
jgi:hypothetical protein